MTALGRPRSAPPAAARPQSLIDPRALLRIKSLQLRAKAAVEGFIKGIHRSTYHGFSVEFSEYRQYTPGDDPRYLDWRLFARTDRYYVKRFEDETNLRCHLVLDTSRSMSYRSGDLQQERIRPHRGGHHRLLPDPPARRGRAAHVRGPDHRLPPSAPPPGPSSPPPGDARPRAQGSRDRPRAGRSRRSRRPSRSAG